MEAGRPLRGGIPGTALPARSLLKLTPEQQAAIGKVPATQQIRPVRAPLGPAVRGRPAAPAGAFRPEATPGYAPARPEYKVPGQQEYKPPTQPGCQTARTAGYRPPTQPGYKSPERPSYRPPARPSYSRQRPASRRQRPSTRRQPGPATRRILHPRGRHPRGRHQRRRHQRAGTSAEGATARRTALAAAGGSLAKIFSDPRLPPISGGGLGFLPPSSNLRSCQPTGIVLLAVNPEASRTSQSCCPLPGKPFLSGK